MSTVGGRVKGRDIGKSPPKSWFEWATCLDCGKERWVLVKNGQLVSSRCSKCHNSRPHLNGRGEKHCRWKGGKYKTLQGYIKARLYPDNFFYEMIDKTGCVFEHRLVMAKHLGRCLRSDEIVHHENGEIMDNSIGNLCILTRSQHTKLHRDT